MLINEAAWIASELRALSDDSFPVLNVGSSTGAFREVEQPWVSGVAFQPITERGKAMIHMDLKASEGVDLVVDFLRPDGREQLRGLGTRTVLCSNLLEHLPRPPAETVPLLCELVPPGGSLILTMPQAYPLHPDPIDNGSRPTPQELAGMLPPGFEVLASKTVQCHRVGWYYWRFGGARFVVRMALPVVRPRSWARKVGEVGVRTKAACIHARRLHA